MSILAVDETWDEYQLIYYRRSRNYQTAKDALESDPFVRPPRLRPFSGYCRLCGWPELEHDPLGRSPGHLFVAPAAEVPE
ncbi:MAG TPA: hypothetical protein VFF67_10175 [Thermoplasmata archaeon]|nr:hypothetical protein [Thermoplasmata archaeon]